MSQQCLPGLQGIRGPTGQQGPPGSNPLDTAIISLNTGFVSRTTMSPLGPLIGVMDRPFNVLQPGRNVVFPGLYDLNNPSTSYIFSMGDVNIQLYENVNSPELIILRAIVRGVLGDPPGSMSRFIQCYLEYNTGSERSSGEIITESCIAVILGFSSSAALDHSEVRNSSMNILASLPILEASRPILIDSTYIISESSNLSGINTAVCILNDITITVTTNQLSTDPAFTGWILRPVFIPSSLSIGTDIVVDAVTPNTTDGCNNAFNSNNVLRAKGHATEATSRGIGIAVLPRDVGFLLNSGEDPLTIDLANEYQGREVSVANISATPSIVSTTVGSTFLYQGASTPTFTISSGFVATFQMDPALNRVLVTSYY
uniref:Uncharacterized protein n=1 Tax=viral metagenome TaxID=1070528 RepID=A0A6C0BKR6_9ZZZZ